MNHKVLTSPWETRLNSGEKYFCLKRFWVLSLRSESSTAVLIFRLFNGVISFLRWKKKTCRSSLLMAAFSPLQKGFISLGERLFSKHLIILVLQGHLTARPAESAGTRRVWQDTKNFLKPPVHPQKLHKPNRKRKQITKICRLKCWRLKLFFAYLQTEKWWVFRSRWWCCPAGFKRTMGLNSGSLTRDWPHTWSKGELFPRQNRNLLLRPWRLEKQCVIILCSHSHVVDSCITNIPYSQLSDGTLPLELILDQYAAVVMAAKWGV